MAKRYRKNVHFSEHNDYSIVAFWIASQNMHSTHLVHLSSNSRGLQHMLINIMSISRYYVIAVDSWANYEIQVQLHCAQNSAMLFATEVLSMTSLGLTKSTFWWKRTILKAIAKSYAHKRSSQAQQRSASATAWAWIVSQSQRNTCFRMPAGNWTCPKR